MVEKRFPANITLEEPTFLNNKNIDGELYAILQTLSVSKENETFVYKWDMPRQEQMCERLGIKSAKTYRLHLQHLIDNKFVIDDTVGCRYILPNVEPIYLLLPLSTLRFLNDTLQPNVIKIYIYLGQKWKNALIKEFTYEELGRHIGIKVVGNARAYEMLKNALLILEKCGLIKISDEYFNSEHKSRHRLLDWRVEIG